MSELFPTVTVDGVQYIRLSDYSTAIDKLIATESKLVELQTQYSHTLNGLIAARADRSDLQSRLDAAVESRNALARDLNMVTAREAETVSRLYKALELLRSAADALEDRGAPLTEGRIRDFLATLVERQRPKGCPNGCGMPEGHEEPCFKG